MSLSIGCDTLLEAMNVFYYKSTEDKSGIDHADQ